MSFVFHGKPTIKCSIPIFALDLAFPGLNSTPSGLESISEPALTNVLLKQFIKNYNKQTYNQTPAGPGNNFN